MSDPGHPPLYYLFLKLWSLISDHLFWLRLSSLFFFLINLFLLGKIGLKIRDCSLALILIFLYSFSGYFIIFDWQVRMYTGLMTLILASLFFLLNKNLLFFTATNVIGLYFDYGFLWYLIPLLPFIMLKGFTSKDAFFKKLFFSLTFSFSFFLLWLPPFLKNYHLGLEGVRWLKPFITPSFLLPYFLGTHLNIWFTFLFLLMGIFGFYLFWQQEKQEFAFQIIFFSALVSSGLTILFSILVSPIFHPRSFQIVGIAIIFLLALLFRWLYQRRIIYLLFGIGLLFLGNFFLNLSLFFQQPGSLLLSFLPWREVKKEAEKKGVNYLIIQETQNPLSETRIWGLKYTLEGKESLPSKKIPYFQVSPAFSLEDNCEVEYDEGVRIYGCW